MHLRVGLDYGEKVYLLVKKDKVIFEATVGMADKMGGTKKIICKAPQVGVLQ